MELGTKVYPYRTIFPVFSEILKQHSHQDRQVNIHIKEGTTVFLQDSKAYLLNITKVKITSYNDAGVSQGMATIMTTDAAIEGTSKKAAFHILKDLTLDTASIISAGTFSATELSSVGGSGDSIH